MVDDHRVPTSDDVEVSTYLEIAKQKGRKIYHLNIGDPDLPPHRVFLEALDDFQNGYLLPYAESNGESDLLEALIRYYHQLIFPTFA
jgi:aspartate aminotransferase